MHMGLVCSYTDWLNGLDAGGNPTGKGVNDYLASGVIPIDAADVTVPPTPLDLVGAIVDPYRDDKCASFDTPSVSRAIYVLPDGPAVAEGTAGPTTRKARSVAVTARVISKSSKKAAAKRWGEYVLRAIGLSTAAYLEDSTIAAAARERLGITVVAANRVTFGPWSESVGDATATHIFAFDAELRDHVARA